MDTNILIAIITSSVALLTALLSAIISYRSIIVQREQTLKPLQREFLNNRIQKLEGIKNELRIIQQTKIEDNSENAKEKITTTIAEYVHILMNEMPELIEKAFSITKNIVLTKLKEDIEKVNEYKSLEQAEIIFGSTKNNTKLQYYRDNTNPIETVLEAEDEFINILTNEISINNQKIERLLNDKKIDINN